MMTIKNKGDTPRSAPAKTGPPPAANGAEADGAGAVAGVPENELTPTAREAMLGLVAELEDLRRDLKEARARVGYLERLADQDSLVPVVNRRAFTRELSRTMSYARRYGVPCSVLYFDVNELKEINDTHGHAAGDAALVSVAETLVASVREFDIVGRLGGDEFGVILVHVAREAAAEKAASLAAAVEAKPLAYRGNTIGISVAFGSYEFRPDENLDHVIDAADKAMYAHKKGPPDA